MIGKGHNRRQFLRNSAAASAGLALSGFTLTGCDDDDNGPLGPGDLPSPTDRQGQFVEVNGASIFYQTAGQGEPMLLIHGYPLSGALFARNRDALAQRYQVITLDLRGYGMSTAPGVPDSIAI